MFYSHHLLARKTPLGQIWMAATMHAKINRRKLNKLNIINICEEILNPSVPMALRLSGILMGGVVIVYERKVKLLYEDVTRLLVEINEAWKVKAVRDPTMLPKGKSQANYEDVTLPDNQPADLGDLEKPLQFSNSDTDTVMEFHKSAYVAMQLDNVDEPYFSHNPSDENLLQDNHQADLANITLLDRFDSHQGDTSFFNRFERFDIEGDEETHMNYPSDHADMPSTLIPSPPLQDEPQKPDEIQQQHPGVDANQQSDEDKGNIQLEQQRQRPQRRRARGVRGFFMDHEQTIIPGQMYQSWLQNTSDIVSRRGRKRKHLTTMRPMKMARLMELPPVALACGLLTNGSRDLDYPLNLLKQWMRSTHLLHDSPSGRTSPPQPPAPSSSSPPERTNYHDPAELHFEDFSSGVGSQSLGVSVEKQRTRVDDHEMLTEITELFNHGVTEANRVTVTYANVKVTPGNSGDDARSIPSSGSGRQQFLSNNLDVNSGRSNKKRLFSSVLRSGSSLETVAEDGSWHDLDTNFKLSKLPETGLTPDHAISAEMLIETGPTQTQKGPIANQPMDPKTDSIRKQLKDHFDTPGANQRESLNELAQGMNRKQAACLFYQTCVLASRDFLRVEQKVPYGNILISRGAKM